MRDRMHKMLQSAALLAAGLCSIADLAWSTAGSGATLLRAAAVAPAPAATPAPIVDDYAASGAVRWLTMFDPQLDASGIEYSFINLAQCYSVSRLRDAYLRYKVPGFLSLDAAGVWDRAGIGSYAPDCYLFHTCPVKTGLVPNWRANLTKMLDAAEPYRRDGSLLGIFLGDELLCECFSGEHAI